jgi:hypothetical protein
MKIVLLAKDFPQVAARATKPSESLHLWSGPGAVCPPALTHGPKEFAVLRAGGGEGASAPGLPAHLCVAPDIRMGGHEVAVFPGARGQDPPGHHPRSLLPGAVRRGRPAAVLDVGPRENPAGDHLPPSLPRTVHHLPLPARLACLGPALVPDRPAAHQMRLRPLHPSWFRMYAVVISLQ